jgi:hypothetical protein
MTLLHDRDSSRVQELRRLEEQAKEKHGFLPHTPHVGWHANEGVYTILMTPSNACNLVDVPVASVSEYVRLTKCTCHDSAWLDQSNIDDIF